MGCRGTAVPRVPQGDHDAACISGETQCPYSETTFRQDRASAGLVEQVERFDGASVLLTRNLEEYQVNDTTAPYTALNTASESQIIVARSPGAPG